MSFFNKLSDWFHNKVIAVTYDPASNALTNAYNNSFTKNLSTLHSTVGNIGGGLGTAVMSIPGVGNTIMNAFRSLQAESKKVLASAKSMTPNQLAAANDDLAAKAAALEARAKEQGLTVDKYKELDVSGNVDISGHIINLSAKVTPKFTISSFFTSVFNNTLYICLFILILFMALLGSSLAANAAYDKPIAFRIYYMIYGFILFPISIIIGIYHYTQKKVLFHAIWAPLHKSFSQNKLLNILLFPFIYTPAGGTISHFTNASLVQSTTKQTVVQNPLAKQATISKKFDPTAV